MGGEIRTLSDCIGLLQAAVHQAPLGQDVRLKAEDVHRIIAALEAAEKALGASSPSGDHVDDHDRGAELVTRRGAAIAVAHSRLHTVLRGDAHLGDPTPPIRDPRDVSCFRERCVAQARTPPR